MDIQILAAFGGLPAAVTMCVSVVKALVDIKGRAVQVTTFAVTALLVGIAAVSGMYPAGMDPLTIGLHGVYSAAAAMGIHEVASKQ